MPPEPPAQPATQRFKRRTRTVLGATVLTAVAVLLTWYAADLLLLTFAGLLVASFLRALSDPLARHTALTPGWALVVTLVGLSGVGGLLGWLLATDLLAQLDQLSEDLPRAWSHLEADIRAYEPGARLLDEVADVKGWVFERRVVSRATGLVSSTFAALSGLLYLVVLGLFVAASPDTYASGVTRLFPRRRRARVGQILATIAGTLRWWLVGKALEMALIAVVTSLGLHLIGLQPALALGGIAGLLAFVPYLGPLLSFVPAVLLAVVQGPALALKVVALYAGIQLVESNLLTPLMERKTVLLPPALTIFTQALAALLFGFLGVLVASPLTAAGLVLVKMAYLEDVLGEDVPDV